MGMRSFSLIIKPDLQAFSCTVAKNQIMCHCGARISFQPNTAMLTVISEETKQVLFQEGVEALRRSGNSSPEELLNAYYHRVCDGLVYLTESFEKWWMSFRQEDVVDVGRQGKDPYSLTVERFQLQYIELSSDAAVARGFLPSNIEDAAERQALNQFWKQAIADFRNDPVLSGRY
jgi:hypothetical protein